MGNITAADVNKLRQQTGLGMMDCKKALTEADGNFDKAIEILRKKGQKVASSRSGRDASEGLVIAKTTDDGKKGIILVLNCETDFVAKNADFNSFANSIAEIAIAQNSATLDELKNQSFNGSSQTISDKIVEEIGKIGEKIELADYGVIESERVVAYNHPGNNVASIVGLTCDYAEAGKDIAMQVAAMNPVALDKDGVSQEVIDKEIEIGKEQAKTEGKPEELLEKIAIGKLNKFYKENTLLNQEFIKDSKKTVSQYLKETDSDLTITGFKRIALI